MKNTPKVGLVSNFWGAVQQEAFFDWRFASPLFRDWRTAGGGNSLLVELLRRFCKLALALHVEAFDLRAGVFFHVGVFAEYACHSDVSFASVYLTGAKQRLERIVAPPAQGRVIAGPHAAVAASAAAGGGPGRWRAQGQALLGRNRLHCSLHLCADLGAVQAQAFNWLKECSEK